MKLTRKLAAVFALALMMTVAMASPAMAQTDNDLVTVTANVDSQISITIANSGVIITNPAFGACTQASGEATWTVVSNAVWSMNAAIGLNTGLDGDLTSSNIFRDDEIITATTTCGGSNTWSPSPAIRTAAPAAASTVDDEFFAAQLGAYHAAGGNVFAVTYTATVDA